MVLVLKLNCVCVWFLVFSISSSETSLLVISTSISMVFIHFFRIWESFKGERGKIIASQCHFPDFYTKQALKVWVLPLHAVFYSNVKGKTWKKRKNTASFVAPLGAGVQPWSTVQLFMPVSDVEKRPSLQFFLDFGVSLGKEKPFVTRNFSF